MRVGDESDHPYVPVIDFGRSIAVPWPFLIFFESITYLAMMEFCCCHFRIPQYHII